MNYQSFISAIIYMLQQRLGDGYKVSYKSIIKNNNVYYETLVILHNQTTSPIIYLQKYYKEYLSHNNLNTSLENILEFYHSYKHTIPLDKSFLSDFNTLKSQIAYKLINFNSNSELLSDIPYIPFLDLAIVYYIYMYQPSMGYMSILVKNQYLHTWQITASELFDIAHKNTYKLLGCRLESIDDVLLSKLYHERQTDTISINSETELIDNLLQQLDNIRIPSENLRYTMYILSNQLRTFGAACLLYPQVIKSIATQLGKDIIIIPSSIHGATCC